MKAGQTHRRTHNTYLIWTIVLIMTLASCKSSEPIPAYDSAEIFRHGVASGDPLTDRVIIWTRVTSPFPDSVIQVKWEMAQDEQFRILVKEGFVQTSGEKDYTVKADVDELLSGTSYFYRFKAFGAVSPAGRTRTAPSGSVDSLKFAIVSCSNYEWGYFNAYQSIARESDLAAVLHLGDYIYEYGPGAYGDTTIGRVHEPAHEILTLDDYRTRYAQYRMDPDLQAAHSAHPFITIWDDHEIANNAFLEGAQNHQPNEGSYASRKAVARQVYYEWMPVREQETLYRKFDFGRLVRLIMLDERLEGRTSPVDDPNAEEYRSEERSMLGNKQFTWLTDQLVRSRADWNIIGNQVIFSRLDVARGDVHLNMDAWDGYPYEQERLAEMMHINQFDNIIFVTGDTHSSWAFETTLDPFGSYDTNTGDGVMAIEFGTTSINSANSNESYPDSLVIAHEQKLLEANPHLKYVNLRDHGYLLLTVSETAARADFRFVMTTRERDPRVIRDKSIWVKSGEYKLLDEPPSP